MKNNFSFANKCFIHSLLLCFVISAMILPTVGCNSDEVIATLQTADAVAKAAIDIISPVNQQMASVMSKVDTDLQTVVKAYQDYEAALPTNKATAGDLVRATVGTIQTNLAAILSDIGVKNPSLLRDVNIAVAVVNSAVTILLSKVNGVTAQAVVVGGPNLPLITGAKSHKDLKNAWNAAIKADFPNAVVN